MDVEKEREVLPKSYCRLCVRAAENGYEILDDVTKMMLEVLMIELNWSLTKDPVICKECAKTIRKSYNFKITCIDSTNRVKDEEFRIREVSKGSTNTETISENMVCGFCKSQIKSDNHTSMDVLLNNSKFVLMLSEYMPEMEPDVIKRATTCTSCVEDLKTCFNFVCNCLNVEKKLNTYIKGKEVNGSMNQVNLSNVHNFLFGSTIEWSQVPQGCTTLVDFEEELEVFEVRKKVDVPDESLKYEVVDIKDGSLIVNKGVTKRGYSWTREFTDANLSDIATHECSFMSSEERSKYLSIHTDEFGMYKCDRCLYKTHFKDCLSDHLLSHKDRSKYKCESCTFETRQKFIIKKHVLTHRKMYKCEVCPYETKLGAALERHTECHTDLPDKDAKKCKSCSFATKSKGGLLVHSRLHRDIPKANKTEVKTEVKTYLCSSFTHETKKSQRKFYKCEKCPFKTMFKVHFEKHTSYHQASSKAVMYKQVSSLSKKTRPVDLKAHAAPEPTWRRNRNIQTRSSSRNANKTFLYTSSKIFIYNSEII